MFLGASAPLYNISTSGPTSFTPTHPRNYKGRRRSISGLGKDGKIADAFDTLSQGISKALRGEKPDSYSMTQPIPIQNVILIVGVGYLAYKLVALAVKK